MTEEFVHLDLTPGEAACILDVLVRHAVSSPAAMLEAGPDLASAIRKLRTALPSARPLHVAPLRE